MVTRNRRRKREQGARRKDTVTIRIMVIRKYNKWGKKKDQIRKISKKRMTN